MAGQFRHMRSSNNGKGFVLQLRIVTRYLARGVILSAGAASVGCVAYYLHQSQTGLSQTGIFRFGRAAWTSGASAWSYWRLDEQSVDYTSAIQQVHQTTAERLLRLCQQNGGSFIKVGQHVASLHYLFPIEYTETLKALHNDAPQSSIEEVQCVIREDFGKDIEELFESFEPEPVGTASLAQVHRAVLKNGEEVAVKVQHPKVRAHSAVDIATMEVLVGLVRWLFPQFKFQWLVEEMRKNIPLELNFISEGQNCERVKTVYKDFSFLKVPEVYWDLSSERVLTMEFCQGGQVDDRQYMKDHEIPVDKISEYLGKLYSEMIFVQGYIHCDPHPGNVLVNKTDSGEVEIVLLDHGLYQMLTDDFRLNYGNLWMSILRQDMEGIKRYADSMNCGHLYKLFSCMVTARAWKRISDGVDRVSKSSEEEEEIAHYVTQYVPEITEVLNSIPRQMILILKTNDVLRGIDHSLGTSDCSSAFLTMSECCVRSVTESRLRRTHNFVHRGWLRLGCYFDLLRIRLYSNCLWLKSSLLVRLHLLGVLIGRTLQLLMWPVRAIS